MRGLEPRGSRSAGCRTTARALDGRRPAQGRSPEGPWLGTKPGCVETIARHVARSSTSLHNLRHAVSRRLPGGESLAAAEAIAQGEAVHAATAAGATAVGLPGEGTLAPGAAADLAVCTGDPFAESSRIAATWVGGRRVWPPDPDLNGAS